MNEMNKEENIVQSTILLIVALTCLSVSWWSMTTGYFSLTDSYIISGLIATTFVLILGGLNHSLRQGIKRGISSARVITIMIFYLLIVALSFAGMFNKFYSEFTKKELLLKELSQKQIAIKKINNRIQGVFTFDRSEKRGNLDTLLNNLKTEMHNPGELGYGKNSEAVMKKIEELLAVRQNTFQRIKVSCPSTECIKEAYEIHEKNINNEYARISNPGVNIEAMRQFMSNVDHIVKENITELAQAEKNLLQEVNSKHIADAQSAIRNSVKFYHDLYAEARGIMPTNAELDYDANLISKNEGIGRISHSIESALENITEWTVILAAFLALAIDLIVPIFVFIMTPRGLHGSESSPFAFGKNKNGPKTL